MSTLDLSLAYKSKTANAYLPDIEPGSSIPQQLRSSLAPISTGSRVGIGVIGAITKLLTGQVTVNRVTAAQIIQVDYESSRKNRILNSVPTDYPSTKQFKWSGVEGATGPYLMGLVDSLIHPERHPEINSRFDQAVRTAKQAGVEFPTGDIKHWKALNDNTDFRNSIISLSDAMYYNLKNAVDNNEIHAEEKAHDYSTLFDTTTLISGPDLRMGGKTGKQKADAARQVFSPFARLLRLVKTGGTALLTGPTGTFKTETAKRTAIESAANLVTLKGAAGMEDRDFWGAIVPTENGPTWVDGPLTRAFRQAQHQKTVLIIDELLRFEPLYTNVLVGALDTLSPQELTSMGHTPLHDGPHYCVTLPNGETIPTPKVNLTMIATTNIGDDYIQFTNLDAALLGRFELQMDMPTADPNILEQIYTEKLPGQPAVISQLLKFEKWTQESTSVHGGLLKHSTNPRVTINMLQETTRLTDEGISLAVALEEAFKVTIMPYCSPRDTTGEFMQESMAILHDEFRSVTRLAK